MIQLDLEGRETRFKRKARREIQVRISIDREIHRKAKILAIRKEIPVSRLYKEIIEGEICGES